jgi:putative cell wall-binding protein
LRDRVSAALIAITLVAGAFAVAPAPTYAAGEKVAIIVGPVGSMTNTYRGLADEVANAATAAGATPVKVYSPNATWANVRAAVDGAHVVVYFGHGNGYPNPYGSAELTDRTNGFGLNRTTTNGDGDNWGSTMAYCGEKALMGTLTASDGAVQWQYCGGSTNTDGLTPAPGFTMIYSQAHYTGGWGERYAQTDPRTTLEQAQQRVRNYSYPVLAMGASAYIATAFGDAEEILTRVLTQRTTSFGQIYAAGRGYNAAAQVAMAHPDIGGAQVFVQETVAGSMHFGQPDYWYAFAGDPARTPGGSTAQSRVMRHAGADRYATAAAVSAASFAPGVPMAYVATGTNFPDALAAGAAAVRGGGPVLLVSATGVPAATANELARLRPSVIRVAGGPSVVSDAVLNALRPYATSGVVERVFGGNRYATAAQLSATAFPRGVSVAFVATGQNFPDALAGVAAAGTAGGPILLTTATGIPGETAAELARLAPQRIIVLGGPSVVSDGVVAQLAGYATTGNVGRLSGGDRYATSAAVSSIFGSANVVFIATGQNFPDALGGGAVAGRVGAPLLLVPGTSVPASVAAELRRLSPAVVIVLGGGRSTHCLRTDRGRADRRRGPPPAGCGWPRRTIGRRRRHS